MTKTKPVESDGIMPKYKNQKVEFQGIVFDSNDEKRYYEYLLDEKAKGNITDIILQPSVELLPKFEKHGKKYQKITYAPDFLVSYSDGRQEYLDLKGFSSQQGELRRKLFAYKMDIPLRWVAASKKYSATGWLDYDDLKKTRKQNKKSKGG